MLLCILISVPGISILLQGKLTNCDIASNHRRQGGSRRIVLGDVNDHSILDVRIFPYPDLIHIPCTFTYLL